MTLRRFLTATLLLALSPPVTAQTQQFTRDADAQAAVLRSITRANRSIVLFSPWLKNAAVADALRIATVKRNVRVELLTANATVFEPASYFLGLKLAGCSLSVASIRNITTAAPFLIIDGRTLLRTTTLMSATPDEVTTAVITSPALIKPYQTWADATMKGALKITNSTAAYFLMVDRLSKETPAKPKKN